MKVAEGHDVKIQISFLAVPEPKNQFVLWKLGNDKEDITINLDEGSPKNVQKFIKASKIKSVGHHRYAAELDIFKIQDTEDDLNITFQITNFLKYPDEIFHIVLLVVSASSMETVKDIIVVLLGLILALGAATNCSTYWWTRYSKKSKKTYEYYSS